MGDDPRVRTYLRQGLGDNGMVYADNGDTVTGNFVALISIGATPDASGAITGTEITALTGNIVDNSGAAVTSIFLPTGFVLPGAFTSITLASNATDKLLCVQAPKDTQ